jgi:hypothetical protein
VTLLLAVASPSAPAQEEPDTAPRPDVFRASASSLVASVQVDRDALLPVADLFRFIALDGEGTYESSTRQARASLLFPGNGLIKGPALACGTFGGQFPPEFAPILDACNQYQYPLTVFADDLTPDGTTTGALALGQPGDAISGHAVRATAHAGEDAATTDAELQDLRVLGLPGLGSLAALIPGLDVDASVLTIGSATSRTNQRIDHGALVVDAEAALSDVRLLGGLLRIGGLRSESHVTDDANGTRTATSSLEVSGVTVAGLPAQITEDGIVLGPSDGALGPILQQVAGLVNELLRSLNVTISVLDAEQELDRDGSAVAGANGLLIEVSLPVDGLPTLPLPIGDVDPNGLYVASIQLASTSALGSAFAVEPEETPPESLPFDGGFDGGGAPVDLGGFAPTFDAPPVDLPDVPTASPAPAKRPELTRSVRDLFGDRLGLLYLSLMFATLGLCILPRLTVPARLPGPHP